MKITVCIVEDNESIRFAMEEIIGMDGKYRMAGSFSNAEEALQKIPSINPNIVLMDINLGDGKNGIDCVRELKQKHPEMLFMMCTVYEDDEKIFDALSAGANGYVLKKTTPHKMLEAIKELYEGGAPMSSQIAIKIVRAMQNRQIFEHAEMNPAKKPLRKLSVRENEILQLLANGMLYKEISDHLQISSETVRKHVYHIYEKLHVSNRVEAINKFFDR
ncbi:MAG TPA: response regulator transcription factor [Puia sp.]|nr:response regulator transcription factor [Puia sp.]